MAPKVTKNLTLEDAELKFRNFSGLEGQFNAAGRRNFCVILPDDVADVMMRDGWNVKYLKPIDPEDKRLPYIQVKVEFAKKPPRIVVITSKGKHDLTEDTVGMLDWAEFDNVDLIVAPYNWEVGGKSGVKGYLKTMYVTIHEDEFAKKYENVPDSAASSLDVDGHPI